MKDLGPNELRILTGADCAALLYDLRRVLSEAGLRLEDLELWNDLEDVRWLSTMSGPVLQVFENPNEISKQRRILGFKDAVFIKRSIRSLDLTRGFQGWRNPAVHLRHWRIRKVPGGESSLPVQQAQQAMDYLYEIEVASRLSFTFSKIRFSEPDLLIEDPDSTLAWTVACKRPRLIGSIPRMTRKAAKQITREGRLGIVMISLDNLIDQVAIDVSGGSLEGICQKRMSDCVELFSLKVLAELKSFLPLPANSRDNRAGRGILGALTTGSFLLLGRDGPTGAVFLNTRMEPNMINRNQPEWARKASWFLVNALKQADEKLKTSY